MRKRTWSMHHRTNAINLFILLLVSCPDLVDVQVVALAVQYMDRYVCACGGGPELEDDNEEEGGCAVVTADAATAPPSYMFYHVAAACIALALKWERCDCEYDLVGAPNDKPGRFNRLIEVFQTSKATRLTPMLLGDIQFDVCLRLNYDLWICTPAEWMIMVRDDRPASFVETPLAFSTDPSNMDPYPSPCWLRREPTPCGGDTLPTRAETAAALARLPLEERLLLYALRAPALIEWTPCRLATACMAIAGVADAADLEAARLCTMPNRNWDDVRIVRVARRHRATDEDVVQLRRHLRAAEEATMAGTAWLAKRIPALAPPLHP